MTTDLLRHAPILNNVMCEWKSLKERSKDEILTPKISKTLDIIKWSKVFSDIRHRKTGARSTPLAYVIRTAEVAEAVAPEVVENRCYSKDNEPVDRG